MYQDEIPNNKVIIPLIIELIILVVKTNIFQIEDTNRIQNIGTVMCTPCTYICMTIFFAWFEHQHIPTKYANNLIMYRCQIDDIFRVWIDTPEHPSN